MKRAIAIAFLVASAQQLGAQETQDTFHLDQVVVSATRLPQPLTTVPAAVSVITAADFARFGLRNVADVLRTVSGAAIVQGGSYGALSSLFLRGGESDYVQVLLDGVQINSPGELFDYSALSLENIARIEVVKGPVSVLYGSDAVAGVVHLFSKQSRGGVRTSGAILAGGGQKVGASASGDFRALDARADVTGGTSALQYSFGLAHFGTDGTLAYNNDHRLTSGTARLATLPGAALDAALTARVTRNRFHYPTDGAGQLVDTNQYHEADALAVGFDAGYRFDTRTELRAQLSWSRNRDHINDQPDSPADTIGFYRFISDEDFVRRSLDARAQRELARGVILTLGGELEQQQRDGSSLSQGSFGDFASTADNQRDNRAAYSQLVATRGRIALQGGARVDHNDAFGEFFTYRAGASLQLHRLLRVRISGGTAFKEPRFYEQFAQGEGTTGNPELDPEHSRSVELGADLGGRDWTFGATAFRQSYRDLIQYTFAPGSEVNWINVGEVRSRGLELETRLNTGLATVRGSVTLLDTEVTDHGDGSDPLYQEGERLIRRPGRTASLSVNWGTTYNLALIVTHVGERTDVFYDETFTAQRVQLPAYTRLDANVRSPSIAGLRGIVKLENALDENYEEIHGFPARGRVVFLGVSFDFE